MAGGLVSDAHGRRAKASAMNHRWISAALAGIVASCGVLVFSEGCERYADVRQENDDTLFDNAPVLEAGPIPTLDSGLETDAYMACVDRPIGECVGTNDFLCGFEKWFKATALKCNAMTGCATHGWLEARMENDGCVSEIRMDKPSEPMVACLVAEFGAYRCPCGIVEASYYFGNTNTGTCAEP